MSMDTDDSMDVGGSATFCQQNQKVNWKGFQLKTVNMPLNKYQ